MKTTDTDIIVPVSNEPDVVFQAFAEYLADKDRSMGTIKGFSQDLKEFSSWCTTEYKTPFTMENFNRHDLRSFQRWSKDQKQVSPGTWNRRMCGLHVFSKWLNMVGLITYDPTDVLKRAAEQYHAPRWMTDQEYRAFTVALELYVNAKCKGVRQIRHDMRKRDYAMISIMLYAGLRVAEVCSLDVSDVVLSERKGMVVVRLGKGRKLRRVPLNLECRSALEPWLEYRKGKSSDPLFLSNEGKRVSIRTVQNIVGMIGKLGKLDGISPHDLRHTCAKRMINGGARLEEVKEILGHSSLNTTFIYVQPGWEDLTAAVERI